MTDADSKGNKGDKKLIDLCSSEITKTSETDEQQGDITGNQAF